MFTRRIHWIIPLVATLFILAGCNLPGQQATPTTDPGWHILKQPRAWQPR